MKVVVETIGGTRFAYPYVKACLESGRSVETTTITGSLADSTILFTLKMLFTEPTDVPPNFITFMKILI